MRTHYIGGSVFFNPQYTADLKGIREIHGVEGVHSKTVIFEIKDHFLYYVADCENMYNPIIAPISSTLQEASIYSDDGGASRTFML